MAHVGSQGRTLSPASVKSCSLLSEPGLGVRESFSALLFLTHALHCPSKNPVALYLQSIGHFSPTLLPSPWPCHQILPDHCDHVLFARLPASSLPLSPPLTQQPWCPLQSLSQTMSCLCSKPSRAFQSHSKWSEESLALRVLAPLTPRAPSPASSPCSLCSNTPCAFILRTFTALCLEAPPDILTPLLFQILLKCHLL